MYPWRWVKKNCYWYGSFSKRIRKKRANNQIFFLCLPPKENLLIPHLKHWGHKWLKVSTSHSFWGVLSPVFSTLATREAERTEDARIAHTLYNRPNRGEITLHYLYINVVFQPTSGCSVDVLFEHKTKCSEPRRKQSQSVIVRAQRAASPCINISSHSQSGVQALIALRIVKAGWGRSPCESQCPRVRTWINLRIYSTTGIRANLCAYSCFCLSMALILRIIRRCSPSVRCTMLRVYPCRFLAPVRLGLIVAR